MKWFGVLPAMTTPFTADLAVDHDFLGRHAAWLLENGCHAWLRSAPSAKGNSRRRREDRDSEDRGGKRRKGRERRCYGCLIAFHRNAVVIAKEAEQAGCSGLMVLPPYVYSSDWREMKQHVAAVIGPPACPACSTTTRSLTRPTFWRHTSRSLREHENLQAVKESSADVRRVMTIREVLGDRLKIFVGVDDVLWRQWVPAATAGSPDW